MKKIIAALSLGLILFSCNGTDKVEVGNKTEIEVKPVINVGNVVLGEEVKTSFEVKNVGSYPLILAEVSGSCTCTVAKYPKDPIAPGETGVVEATVKTDRANAGPLTKDVRIMANTEPSLTTVMIKANVIRK